MLVKTAASAICRSDMSIYYGNPVVGEHAADAPLVVPGHEAAGVVVEVGSAVQGVQVGDRVAGYLAVSEQRAGFAAVGLPMLDPGWKCFGFDIDGGDADFFVLPEANCLPLPDAISFRAGAVLTDMVGTQYHTQKRLGVSARHTVAVVGLGPMGAAAVLISNALGARVMAVDVLDSRLEQASSLGATELVNSARVDPVARIAELTGGRGADVVIECSGNPVGQNTALDVAAKLGSVAFVGESRKTEINPSDQIIRKMLTVIGGWYFPRGEWDEIVRFVLDRSVAVEDLISHEFSIEDAEHAFSAFDRRETDKAVFVW
ncbi:zinc-binding dehydrogenase [Amnibacterium sp.]|uniref:zinc-binding dehydrogenase n=1 Tax=Amnibacterium sp. TaxID=1872496 RepID=UPI00262E1845|nr:zinc-binding dehydrogenase [Amnibacterium sp.]